MTARRIEVTLRIVRDGEPIVVVVRVDVVGSLQRLIPESTGRNDGADYHLTSTERDEARRAAADALRRHTLN